MIPRREFISLIGGAAAAWPLAARAQQPAMPVIGFIHTGSPEMFAHVVGAFRNGLNEFGLIEGRNFVIEFRWAQGHLDRLPAFAAELVERRVSVIAATGGTASGIAAKRSTTTIPIVFTTGGDAVKFGLVTSLSRPTGNVTGINVVTTALEAKRLGLLRELVPQAARIAYIVNPGNPDSSMQLQEVEKAARDIGVQVDSLNASVESDFRMIFKEIVEHRVRAILFANDALFQGRRALLVGLAAQHSIPAMYAYREFVIAGGLMSYAASLTDAYRQAGIYVARVLKGEKPSNLPVLQPTKFELVINLKVARKLGLAVPPTLLALADEVIE